MENINLSWKHLEKQDVYDIRNIYTIKKNIETQTGQMPIVNFHFFHFDKDSYLFLFNKDI